MRWSIRHATWAAQKIPENADKLLYRSAIRQAMSIRNFHISASLRVNSDQTQVVLQSGSKVSWHRTGDKQVTTHGFDEKWAMTLMAGVSASGMLLPFQSMWQGYTNRSLPSPRTPGYLSAVQKGFLFEFTSTKTYWSTELTMQSYVEGILVPYFHNEQGKLGLLMEQSCLWQINIWSVHSSKSFRQWMSEHYPWIILDYVPAGCTGLFQPCDVGMQRVMKQAIIRAQSADLIEEVSGEISKGIKASQMRIDITVPTLRDRSVGWLVKAHELTNSVPLVKAVRSGPYKFNIF
jgi:hypothetical protein